MRRESDEKREREREKRESSTECNKDLRSHLHSRRCAAPPDRPRLPFVSEKFLKLFLLFIINSDSPIILLDSKCSILDVNCSIE